jgi:hypothetical protein
MQVKGCLKVSPKGPEDAGTHEDFEPPAFPLGPDLAASNEIAFRNDSDQLAGISIPGETANLLVQHYVRSFEDRFVGFRRSHLAGHDLMHTL